MCMYTSMCACATQVRTVAITRTPVLLRSYTASASFFFPIIFAPYFADAVGVYDVLSSTFDYSVATGNIANRNFACAAAVGNIVVFAPMDDDRCVRAFCEPPPPPEPVTNLVSCSPLV